ncbi:MAG: hypothetical protein Kow001_20560 [Acidobacteriota bacterium]
MRSSLCNRQTLAAFIKNELAEDDRLDFLIHVDSCTHCWDAVYAATKAAHPHYYKRAKSAKTAELDLPAVTLEEAEEGVFEVA